MNKEKNDSGVLSVTVAQSSLTLCDPMDCTVHEILQAINNNGVGSLSLLQGIFPTQGSNPGLHTAGRFYFTSYEVDSNQ